MGSSRAPGGMAVLGAVVFIMLAGVRGGEISGDSEGPPTVRRRCYWCGPLAEQVHHSERAETCGPSPRQRPCDSPHHFCATIASAPPYAESRLCVKKFYETCFPLFCNTTSVWKVVCTCRGDLCNGAVTQEAAFAFHVLTALNESDIKYLVKREAISLHDHSHDTDIVNQLATQPNMPIDKPTGGGGTAAGDNKLVTNVDNTSLEASNAPEIAKEGEPSFDKDLKKGMNQESDEPSHDNVASETMSVKEAETTAAAMRAAVDPDHHHYDHEHGVMTTTHSTQVHQPDDFTILVNQTAHGTDNETPKNYAQNWSRTLTFDVLVIICIKLSLLL